MYLLLKLLNKNIKIIVFIYKILFNFIFIHNGDWGLGIGDWGLGIGPNPQSPIPNPQPNKKKFFSHKNMNLIFIYFN
jgi:hypothetical protein